MDFLKYFFQVTLGTAIELVKLLPIMILVFGFKLQPAKKIIIYGLCTVILLIISAVCKMTYNVPIYTYISILLVIFIIKGNNRIIYTMISYLGIGILDMLTATVWLLFNDQSYAQLADDTAKHIIINAVNIAAIFVICITARLFFSKKKHISPQNARRSYLILILLGEISLLMFITTFQLNESADDKAAKTMAVCLSIGSIVFLLTAIILLINNISKNHFKKISEMNEKLIQSQEQYYTMLLQKEEETRKFRHDINNHLNCMRLLFEEKKYDELNEYFDKIGAYVLKLRPELQLGNNLISAILNDVSSKYSSVIVEIEGKMPSTLRIDNMDICTLFYNLFDNAFAAAEKAERKSVEVSVKLLGENLFFTIKNSTSHKVEIVNNVLTTEKKDAKHHGFGSGNAVTCAEKNGGALTYKCSDNYFEAELILPNIDAP